MAHRGWASSEQENHTGSTPWRRAGEHTAGQPDSPQAKLVVVVNSFQRVAPLTIGEIGRGPSMLKLALIENLRVLGAAGDAGGSGRSGRGRYN